ncbi:MAG: outer membrane lipoprotein-sorting protein [Chthoniobacterales bacterium]
MKSLRQLSAGFAVAGFIGVAFAADPAAPMSAADLASRLSAQRENGSTDVRLRMEIQQPVGTKKATFQIQIKERRTPAEADVAYVVLWPRERKAESLLVRQKAGAAPEAWHFPAGGKSPEETAMSESVFGSDLAVADVIENFFSWKDQALVGTEVVDRVACQILESKPGSGDFSIYGHVLSWVDPRRMVPLRIEKYLPSGKLARRIETTRVVPQGSHGNLPANLTVRASGKDSLTELDGSRIRYDVTFTDREFTPAGLRELAAPKPEAK